MRTSRISTHVQCRNHLPKVWLDFVTKPLWTQKCNMKSFNKSKKKLNVKNRFMKKRYWSFFWVKLDLLQSTTTTLTSNQTSLNTWESYCSTGSSTFILSTNCTHKHFSLPSTLLTTSYPLKQFTEPNSNLSESLLYG